MSLESETLGLWLICCFLRTMGFSCIDFESVLYSFIMFKLDVLFVLLTFLKVGIRRGGGFIRGVFVSLFSITELFWCRSTISFTVWPLLIFEIDFLLF